MATKEQMNVQITADVKQLAKTCAAVSRMSFNSWVENAIRAQAEKDRKTFRVDEVTKDLKKVAEKYLPGKVATHAEMLTMARRVAAEDTQEGFTVEHYTKPSSTARKRTKS
jgi:hypothetical protein